MSEKPVVLILAAGLGTRMKSDTAKVLHQVAGRPLIIWAVEAARAAGAGRTVAILGHQSEIVRELLEARYGDKGVEIVIQAEQRGTGHAVSCALDALGSEPDARTVVILSGDAPLLDPKRVAALADACEHSAAGMALLSTRPPRPMPYGRLVRDADSSASGGPGRLLRIVEHADASEEERAIDEVNAGFYAIQLRHLREGVAGLDAGNAKGELYLTDLAAAAAERGGAAVLDAPWEEVSGINDRVDLAAVDAVARRHINERWMRDGVTIIEPESVYIDADAGPIGRDTWIGPGVALRGTTRVGERVRIDLGCVLTNTVVGDAVTINPHSMLDDTEVGPRAKVGPFSRCRPGTKIDEEVSLGNFVETKKAHLMAGAKANHLSYLGDVSVGAKSNIGAGTITCNYDGFGKYRTTIEAGAFIGSDTQLVAPVTVGRDSYVGAGSTVTKDVPRSALALTRVKQVNVEGWAKRFREAQSKRSKKKETPPSKDS